jgi:conjugal transfer pilin signal peptidase TrbI
MEFALNLNADQKRFAVRWTMVGLVLAITLSIIIQVLSPYYSIGFNWTNSLPYRVFLIKKFERPDKYDYIAFVPGKTPYYREDQIYVKILGGVQGDEVTAQDRTYAINGESLHIRAKEWSKKGFPLDPGPVGKIPEHKYFVYTPHEDGYDSRYKDIGWIDEKEIVGRAYPIF